MPASPVVGSSERGEAGVEGMVKSESQLKTFMKLWHQIGLLGVREASEGD